MVAPIVAAKGAQVAASNPGKTLLIVGGAVGIGYLVIKKLGDWTKQIPDAIIDLAGDIYEGAGEIAGEIKDGAEELAGEVVETIEDISDKIDDGIDVVTDTLVDVLPLSEEEEPTAKAALELSAQALFNPLSIIRNTNISTLVKPTTTAMNKAQSFMNNLRKAWNQLLGLNKQREARQKQYEYESARQRYLQAQSNYNYQMNQYRAKLNQINNDYNRAQSQIRQYQSQVENLAIDGITKDEALQTVRTLEQMIRFADTNKYVSVDEDKLNKQISDIEGYYDLF